jgi:hypothetical protein
MTFYLSSAIGLCPQIRPLTPVTVVHPTGDFAHDFTVRNSAFVALVEPGEEPPDPDKPFKDDKGIVDYSGTGIVATGIAVGNTAAITVNTKFFGGITRLGDTKATRTEKGGQARLLTSRTGWGNL